MLLFSHFEMSLADYRAFVYKLIDLFLVPKSAKMATQRDKDVLNMILNPLMPNANFDETSKAQESKEGR
jgi:hypothetical protein